MGLFKSKEQKEKELIEKITKPYIDNGFILSKAVFTMVKFTQGLFIIDTENKKWALIESVYAKDNSNAKIYDFSDIKNYDASNGKIQGNFTSTVRIGGMLSSVSNKQTSMKITLYLNSNSIEDSTISLMDYTFDSDSIAAFNQNTHESRFNDLIKCLEYIQNNK